VNAPGDEVVRALNRIADRLEWVITAILVLALFTMCSAGLHR